MLVLNVNSAPSHRNAKFSKSWVKKKYFHRIIRNKSSLFEYFHKNFTLNCDGIKGDEYLFLNKIFIRFNESLLDSFYNKPFWTKKLTNIKRILMEIHGIQKIEDTFSPF